MLVYPKLIKKPLMLYMREWLYVMTVKVE